MIIATTPGAPRGQGVLQAQFNFTPPAEMVDGTPRFPRPHGPRVIMPPSRSFGLGSHGPVGLISGLGRVRCPEGMTDNGAGVCVCYPGRVLAPDGSKCISPQSMLNTGASTVAEVMAGQTSRTFSQQPLTARARRFIEAQGYRVDCKISERWAATPAGGVAPRLCNVCGESGCSGYKHGSYALNLRPQGAIPGGVVRAVRTPPPSTSASQPVRTQLLPVGHAPTPPPPRIVEGSAEPGPPVVATASPNRSRTDPALAPSFGVDYAPVAQGAGPQIMFAEGGGGFSDLLSAGFNVGGFNIPYWALAVGAYALMRK